MKKNGERLTRRPAAEAPLRARPPRFRTGEHGLAFVLNQEQLAPVGAHRLHPEHHQVGKGQQPQVRREQELGQGAVVA